jgi:hypothetical protein
MDPLSNRNLLKYRVVDQLVHCAIPCKKKSMVWVMNPSVLSNSRNTKYATFLIHILKCSSATSSRWLAGAMDFKFDSNACFVLENEVHFLTSCKRIVAYR